MKIVKVEEIEKRIRNKFPEAHFEIVNYTKTRKPITVKCLDCGEEKTFANKEKRSVRTKDELFSYFL